MEKQTEYNTVERETPYYRHLRVTKERDRRIKAAAKRLHLNADSFTGLFDALLTYFLTHQYVPSVGVGGTEIK